VDGVIIPGHWFTEHVTVETHTGEGPYGDVFDKPVTVLGHVSGGRRVSRSAQNEEVTTDVQVLVPNPARLADGSGVVDPAELLRPQSRIRSGATESTVARIAEYRQPSTGALVYVAAALI
jgi:hypothetical protein